MGGKARFRKDANRIKRLEGKENLNANQQAKLDYLNSARMGQILSDPASASAEAERLAAEKETADLYDPDLIGS